VQLISNTATALILIPLSISAAADLHISAKPLPTAVCVAAGAFLTAVATTANPMVVEPGGNRFGEYRKLGLPLLALFGVAAVLHVPVIWPF
jgi:di/tricarboxylate transporter